jgi:murein DD-endopeptidase MepM/ murein hydrolase activator NlpD
MPIPTGIIIGGGVLACAKLAGDGLDPGAPGPTSTSGPRQVGSGSTVDGWVWPLPSWLGYAPVISDGPGANKRDGGSRSHNGADIDFKRRRGTLPQFKIGTREASASGLYFCPDGVAVLAARDGELWSATESERGLQVVIDHGKPYATYYQHLRRLFVPLSKSGKNPIRIRAGQVIGLVGNGHSPGSQPANAFNHLHFEIWQGGGAASWIDPTPILTRARVVSDRELVLP